MTRETIAAETPVSEAMVLMLIFSRFLAIQNSSSLTVPPVPDKIKYFAQNNFCFS